MAFLNVNRSAPAQFGEAITPHASNNFTSFGARGVARAIYVGGAGDVAVVWGEDSVSVFAAVPVGTILPVEAKRVNATGTTATLLLALY